MCFFFHNFHNFKATKISEKITHLSVYASVRVTIYTYMRWHVYMNIYIWIYPGKQLSNQRNREENE